MTASENTRVVLASRPVNRAAAESDFRLESVAMPEPAPGQVLVRTRFLSLDPYMRTRMSPVGTYAAHVEIGEVMPGEVVGEVIESRCADLHPGDMVLARSGWQSHATLAGEDVTPVDAALAAPSSYLGVLGMPGMTAWFGLFDVGRPAAGDTVFVPAAAGAVGHLVGQLARHHGCRVVGCAGSARKAAIAVDELGFDACIAYRGKRVEQLSEEIGTYCPDGIDVFYDSVGGDVHDAVMPHIAMRARIVIVGAIARASRMEEPDIGPRWMRKLLNMRAKMEGFLVLDYAERAGEFREVMSARLAQGDIIGRECIADGLESAPRAFIDMLAGGNIGKQLVEVA